MIDVRKIHRKAQVFGTSAMELMLIIIFLILLMFLTWVSSIDPSANAAGIEELKKQKEELAEISTQYKANVIEVVGHTDERPVSGWSTLDENLFRFLRGEQDAPLAAADNAGLGFARASAVVRVLRESSSLSNHDLTPLSGAQVILRNGEIADDSQSGNRPQRRRIEIRVRGREAAAQGDSR